MKSLFPAATKVGLLIKDNVYDKPFSRLINICNSLENKLHTSLNKRNDGDILDISNTIIDIYKLM